MDVSEFERGIRLCAFQYEGRRTGYMCPYREYCCSGGCCPSSSITFYQLWYFWLLLLLVVLVCSGSGWWWRWRHSGAALSSPVALAVARRRSQRQRVYPRYHHALDTAPPSYAEVMRRLNEYPQARTLQHGSFNQNDVSWVTSPPPPYETIHDLRQQETKLDQEIELEENPSVPRLNNEMLRRGVSARERRKLSARQRIKRLLGGSNKGHCNPANQAVFAITPVSSTQPLAWSYNAPNLPIMHPLPSMDLIPPYRHSSNYPYSLAPPYIHQAVATAPPLYSDVDEWSRNDCQLRANRSSSRPSTAVHTNFDYLPGGVCGEGNSSAETNVSPDEMEKVFEDIRSPLSPRVANDRPSIDMQSPSTSRDSPGVLLNRISPSINFSSNEEPREVLPSESSEPVGGGSPTFSSSSGQRASVDMTHTNTTPTNNNSLSAPMPSSSKFSTRPVSSTALPTPGLAASSSNLPGATLNTDSEAADENHGVPRCASARSERRKSAQPENAGLDANNTSNRPHTGGSPAHESSFHPRPRSMSMASEAQVSPSGVNSSNAELSAIPEGVANELPVATSSNINGRSLSLPTSTLKPSARDADTSRASDQSLADGDSIACQDS